MLYKLSIYFISDNEKITFLYATQLPVPVPYNCCTNNTTTTTTTTTITTTTTNSTTTIKFSQVSQSGSDRDLSVTVQRAIYRPHSLPIIIQHCHVIETLTETLSTERLCWEMSSDTCSFTRSARSFHVSGSVNVFDPTTQADTAASSDASVDAVFNCWWSNERNVALVWQPHHTTNAHRYYITDRDLRIVFLRSNRISNRINRPIRFRIEFSNRIGRIYHASRNTV